MSKPTPGDYRIVNARQSPDGKHLAITFNGEKIVLVVAKAFDEDCPDYVRQVWTIRDYGPDPTTQTVSPKARPDLQVGFGSADHTLAPLPAGGHVWTIRGGGDDDDEQYTVEDGARTVFWGLNYFIVGEYVSYGRKGSAVVEQEWVFVPVDPA